MLTPGRKFSSGTGYRYGFNGKELDKEVSGTTTYDYGFRIYSPGLGRFLSVDPLTKKYPELTPYQFGSNTPIQGIDLDGLELYKTNGYIGISMNYDSKLKKITSGTTYYRSSQLPDGLNTAIEAANTCDNCIGSSASNVASFTLAFKPPIISSASDASMSDINDLPKSLQAQNHQLPIIPQNKKQAIEQRKTRQFETPGIVSGNNKVNIVITLIDLAGKAGVFLGNQNIEDVIHRAQVQSKVGGSIVVSLLNDAISSDQIPGEYLNSNSLSQVGNYLLYGEEITKWQVSPKGIDLVPDEKLKSIANNILSNYELQQEKEKAKEVNQNSNPIKIDNTRVDKN